MSLNNVELSELLCEVVTGVPFVERHSFFEPDTQTLRIALIETKVSVKRITKGRKLALKCSEGKKEI